MANLTTRTLVTGDGGFDDDARASLDDDGANATALDDDDDDDDDDDGGGGGGDDDDAREVVWRLRRKYAVERSAFEARLEYAPWSKTRKSYQLCVDDPAYERRVREVEDLTVLWTALGLTAALLTLGAFRASPRAAPHRVTRRGWLCERRRRLLWRGRPPFPHSEAAGAGDDCLVGP